MHLRSLSLQNFRRYQAAQFTFSPQVNLIHGPNAIGKTTLLEAIYLLSTGRSFRTHQLKELIHQGKKQFFIEAIFEKHGIEQRLRFAYDGNERKVLHNETPCQSVTALLGLLQCVVVTPDDASLVKGAPQIRRRFLDLQIAQNDPLYVHHLTRYHRAMQQRNVLLKSRQVSSIETWEEQMAQAAAYLGMRREQTVKELLPLSEIYYQTLGQEASLSLVYKGTVGQPELFLDRYKRHREKEMELGFTLSGPHKDDLEIAIGKQEARHFASEGQQRSCVAALRFAEWQRLVEVSDEKPLMLFDDVGVSLDAGRRARLFEMLTGLDQVFLTSTDRGDVLVEGRSCECVELTA